MTNEQLLQQYLVELNQEIRALVEAEEGASVEEKATEYMTRILAEAGETESPLVCTEIKQDKARRVVHKLNGYSVSEDEETIDAFVNWFEENNDLRTFSKANIEQAANQTERFFKNALNGYSEELDEAAPIYYFASRLGLKAVQMKIIRIRIFIITNARYTIASGIPDRKIGNIIIQYHIWDLDRFYALHSSTNNREPIQIDLALDHGGAIPCLAMPLENEDYQSYLAILPGTLLASIYERYGARLLEQNVRSFLQFGNKVNKGIRETIKKEPHRFLAYNNGIAATAASVEFSSSYKGMALSRIIDLQIVNGGQTTAAIYQTQRIDKADLSQVFVQMKLTVIRDHSELEDIVPRISRYANSQNAIKEADLSSNHPFNGALEKISRNMYTPPQAGSTLQTRWYFERARGQYKVSFNKELTPSNKRAFEIKNPKKQIFTKESTAKVLHSWFMKPYNVARGAQKNYATFIAELGSKDKFLPNIDSKKLPTSIFYEDLISLLILQNSAELAYGRGSTKLGDIKFLTVPYTLSLLNHLTGGRLDLPSIWKKQSVSDAVVRYLEDTLPLVEHHLKSSSEGRLIGEYAKKEECWIDLLKSYGSLQLSPDLLKELLSKEVLESRLAKSEAQLSDDERNEASAHIRSFGSHGWKMIEVWGRDNEMLSTHKQTIASSIATAIGSNRRFTDSELKNASEILEKLESNNPSLLDGITEVNTSKIKTKNLPDYEPELIEKLITWEKKNKRLSDKQFNWLKKMTNESHNLSNFQLDFLNKILETAYRYGFANPSPPSPSQP